MVFGLFRRRDPNEALIDRIHGEIVAAGRQKALYLDYGVEDTIDGRFDLLTLHAAIALRRLNALEQPGPVLAQGVVDAIFRLLDANLREMGVGDVTVPKKMKVMVEAFLGRSAALDEALRTSPEALTASLSKNVLSGKGDAERLSQYVQSCVAAFEAASLAQLTSAPLPYADAAKI